MYKGYSAFRILTIALLISIILFFLVSITSIANVDIGSYLKHERDFREGEILVKFRENSSDYSIMSTIELLGASSVQKTGDEPYYLVKLRRGQEVEQAVAAFIGMPNVEYAQPNYIYRLLSTVPNDSDYKQLWGLKNTGQAIDDAIYNINNPGTSGMDMDMESAWDHITDCSSMVVAVIDSGVNYNHEDLAENMWSGAVYHGYDFVDDDEDPMDLNGHGTHVAGTIGAMGDNDNGTTGVCWQVRIMAVRSFNEIGNGTTVDMIAGIHYAVDNGARVLNMSFGQSNFDQALYNAVEYAKTHEVIAITSAGNDGLDNDADSHSYPSDFDLDNIISVAALDQSYELASFSSYGPTSVDVGAPGTNILSELCGTKTVFTPSLSDGWTEGGTNGWAYGTVHVGYGNIGCLQVPWNWGPPSWGTYQNNAQDKMWRTFDLSGIDVASLRYLLWLDVESNYDVFYCVCDDVNGDPFVNAHTLAAWTGSTEGYFYTDEWLIPDSYLTSQCTIGFGLWSDMINRENGVAVTAVSISAISINNNSYDVLQGTSMAAPHVTGLAALVWAFNPDYSYEEVIGSIKGGGETVSSLKDKTVSGNAVNAWGSLTYIKPPTGVTVTFE